jgi:hypothetical protein
MDGRLARLPGEPGASSVRPSCGQTPQEIPMAANKQTWCFFPDENVAIAVAIQLARRKECKAWRVVNGSVPKLLNRRSPQSRPSNH